MDQKKLLYNKPSDFSQKTKIVFWVLFAVNILVLVLAIITLTKNLSYGGLMFFPGKHSPGCGIRITYTSLIISIVCLFFYVFLMIKAALAYKKRQVNVQGYLILDLFVAIVILIIFWWVLTPLCIDYSI